MTDSKTTTAKTAAEDAEGVRLPLAAVADEICTMLKERQPRWIDGVPADAHPLPPFVCKADWTRLGDAIKINEKPTSAYAPGDKWISLRCDGTGFSKMTKRMQKAGIFTKGYSPEFADIMIKCCREVMEKFSARCGYTHSDELTVLMSPASVVRGEQQSHLYSGRIQKLCSLTAATVTARFNHEVATLCREKNVEYVPDMLVTFDCRVGVYDTEQEAMSLVFWRAYDCGVNCTSDACYKSTIPGSKRYVGQPTEQRILWLYENSLLPMLPHQRDGTFLLKRKRLLHGKNQKTGEDVTFLRGRIEQQVGNVLQLYHDDTLLPSDEELPQSGEMNIDNNNDNDRRRRKSHVKP